MDSIHYYINSGLILLIGLVGWLLKRSISEVDAKHDKLDNRMDRLDGDLQNTKQNYMHKDDFKDFKLELRSMFEEIKQDIRFLNDQRK